MKTRYFIGILIASATLFSCENALDPFSDSGEEKTVRMAVTLGDVQVDSKALDVSTANLASFTAFAFPAGNTADPCFSAVTYTKDGSTFVPSERAVWANTAMDFYAFAIGSAAGQVTPTNYKTFTVSPVDNPANQVDLVYACVKNKAYGDVTDGIVPMNFRHAQSKVSVKVKNTSSDFKFTVYGWRVGYFDNSATFTHNGTSTASSGTLPSSCWSANTSPSANNKYTFTLSSSVSVAASATSTVLLSGEAVTIPQSTSKATAYVSSTKLVNGSYVALKIKIQDAANNTVLYGGTSGAWAIWPTAFSWAPGKKYTYVIDLGGCGYYESSPSTSTALRSVLQ